MFSSSPARSWLRPGLLAGTPRSRPCCRSAWQTRRAPAPTVPHGFAISLFASAPTGDSSPDDISRLGDEAVRRVPERRGTERRAQRERCHRQHDRRVQPRRLSGEPVERDREGRRPRLRPREPSGDRDRQRGLELVAGDDHAIGAGVGPARPLPLLAEPESGERLRPDAHRRGHRRGDGDAPRHDSDRGLQSAVLGCQPPDDRRGFR